jgi:Na+-driven multidrug efflux pump
VIAMILLRNVWGYAYSNEEEVVAYIASMLPILAVSFFVDGINGALSGANPYHISTCDQLSKHFSCTFFSHYRSMSFSDSSYR